MEDVPSPYFLFNSVTTEQCELVDRTGKCADDTTAAVVRAANQKKVAVMISVIGKKTYSTFHDLCSPENPKEKHLRNYVNYYNNTSSTSKGGVNVMGFEEEPPQEQLSEEDELRGHIAGVCKKGGVNVMGFEEEPPQEQLSEEDELYVVYDVHAMSRSEISVSKRNLRMRSIRR